MHSPTGPLDIEDNGMMHHAIHDGGGDDGVAKVITELSKVYVRCYQGGTFAVPAVYDLEEQRGISCLLLLQPVKADFVDQ